MVNDGNNPKDGTHGKGGNDIDDNASLESLLDTPFYDPDQVLNDPHSSPLSKQFANFVKTDYITAETLLAGTFFLVLVILSQELLRIQFYGWENYVPFTKGILPGRLF